MSFVIHRSPRCCDLARYRPVEINIQGDYAMQKNLGYDDTPVIPGMNYKVHDGTRPQPRIIQPGAASTQETPGQPPSDAVRLFDGKDLSGWTAVRGGPA